MDNKEGLIRLHKNYDNLQKEKNPKVALGLADSILCDWQSLTHEGRGKHPNPLRVPEAGWKSRELTLRNKLYWLRTIPLRQGEIFISTHIEAGVYRKGSLKRRSADLVGLFCNNRGAKLCVVELKAGKSGNNVIYAIIEGFYNLYLHQQGKNRLQEGWNEYVKNSGEEGKLWRQAWRKSNPFNERLVRSQVLVIGDYDWSQAQEKYKQEAMNLCNKIKKDYECGVAVYSTNKAKPLSKPYCLLPLKGFVSSKG